MKTQVELLDELERTSSPRSAGKTHWNLLDLDQPISDEESFTRRKLAEAPLDDEPLSARRACAGAG